MAFSESEREGYTDHMSQELVAIIGAAIVAVALAVPAQAQVDCADWNTAAFFEAAEVSDVNRCLQAGVDRNAPDAGAFTPLHSAATVGTAEVVTALLEAGAEPKARNRGGALPFDWAETNEQLKGTDAYWKLNDARFQ